MFIKDYVKKGRKFISPYYNFPYSPGQHYYQTGSDEEQVLIESRKGFISNNIHVVKIHTGLHSSLTKDRALIHGQHAIKMIIPKGAKIWIDEELGDLVSTELIFPHQ